MPKTSHPKKPRSFTCNLWPAFLAQCSCGAFHFSNVVGCVECRNRHDGTSVGLRPAIKKALKKKKKGAK